MTEPEQPVVAVPLRAALEEHLAPWFKVPGDDALEEGCMRRCLLCGRTSEIVAAPIDAAIKHEPDCAYIEAALAVEAVRPETDIDPERLARALAAEGRYVGWTDIDYERHAKAVARCYLDERP